MGHTTARATRSHDLEVIRRSDRTDPIDSRRLQRAIREGQWVRVAPGAFCPRPAWDRLTPRERHVILVLEVSRRLRAPAVLSHHAAAALWQIDVLGSWPARVDVTTGHSGGSRREGWVRRHTIRDGQSASIPLGDHVVTTAAQTAADLARALPFAQGVAAIDQAICARRAGGALTTLDEIAAIIAAQSHRRGNIRAARAVAFASPQAENVRESEARVLLAQLGFPTPRVQEYRVLRTGREVYGDFYFPEHDHWAELDGRGKYLSPEFGAHRSPEQIVIDEKNRENEIRREVRGFSRWEPADHTPRRLYDILTRDGLPSRRPRP